MAVEAKIRVFFFF